VTPALLDRRTFPAAGPDPEASPAAGRTHAAGATFAAGAVGGGRMTLEERLNSVLHEARTNGSTDCPICRARMTREAATASAACGDCGSRLS
jgi:hypothetical protein